MRLYKYNLILLKLINLEQKAIPLNFHRFICILQAIRVFKVHQKISCLYDDLIDAFNACYFQDLLFIAILE